MTSSNGNIFRVTGLLCGEFTGHRWIPRTKASDAFAPEQRFSKQSRRRCFAAPSRPLWHNSYEFTSEHMHPPPYYVCLCQMSFDSELSYNHDLFCSPILNLSSTHSCQKCQNLISKARLNVDGIGSRNIDYTKIRNSSIQTVKFLLLMTM